MKILITGGAGTLGINLINFWLPQGHEILVIDNFATSNPDALKQSKSLQVCEGSIADASLVEKQFNEFQPEIVVNSAASYKDPDHWQEDIDTNITGMVNLIRNSQRVGISRFINFQTALCYGTPEQLPVPLTHPLNPVSSYGISKTSGECFLMHSDLPYVSLRLASICSPGLAIGPIPTFYQRLKQGKNCFCTDTRRDFIDIDDFLSLMDTIMSGKGKSGAYNVSTGISYSIKDIFNVVSSYLDLGEVDVPIKPVGKDDVKDVALDPLVTEREFNWKANVDFKSTIEKQLAWYDEFGITTIYSHIKSNMENVN